jgi:hypothetical protein
MITDRLRAVLNAMWVFATERPSPQQTRQKSAREMVEHFARELEAALVRAGDPEPPIIRAHVEGCSKALSVPVDVCPCGGRDFTPAGVRADATPATEPDGWLLIETWRDGSQHHEGIAVTHEGKDLFMRGDYEQGHSRSAVPRKIWAAHGPSKADQ